ncbi:outer membrane beta-barrel protein [Pseudotamlana agarivorans]|uniref:outer membrane beta-barrel protein n=1 Tax=Pseudotamlana agarivorans TaxID=481183 RepID=UPI0008352DB2|nr:outer membrane beta-barrel protein [Tamlana agarivorans]
MKLKFIMLVGTLVLTLSTFAQEKYSLSYIIGIPSGPTADFTPSTSFRGVGFDFTYMLSKELGIGASVGLQTFYDDLGKQTITDGTETTTATRYHYINSLPVYATASYFFNNSNNVTPFVSLGIGLMYNQIDEEIGVYTLEDDAWQFSMRPEIGLEYTINYGVSLRAAGRYNYAAKSGDVDGLSHFGIALGVTWSN